MTSDEVKKFIDQVVLGNEDAKIFLLGWHSYLHAIDDIVDGDSKSSEVVTVTRWAVDLYSLPFYIKNYGTLYPLIQLITCTYEDSIELGNDKQAWAKHTADVIRHTGADMVRIVAFLIGGYVHMRKVSMILRHACYFDHHTQDGQPI